MSVQAGVWNFDETPVLPALLDRFGHLTAPYAPDGQTTRFEKFIGMLFRPFYTTLESRFEVQPYVSPAGHVFTWDGRLDNRDELTSLVDVVRDTRVPTDIAIVAASFDRWGTNCFAKLTGDWALAVWSRQKRELILARDYIGVKPLFYYAQARRLMWCSHLAPLALCGERFTLCEEYIAGYLAFHPDAHLTPYREIRSVPPGNFVRIRKGQTTASAYWTPKAHPATRHRSDTEYEEHFRHLLGQAIRRRLRTDSPVLAELSGGLDSSSLVCLADQLIAKGEASVPQLDTFSYYDSNEPGEDDLFHLSRVEEKRGRRGFQVDLKGEGDSLALEDTRFAAIPGFRCRAEINAAMAGMVEANNYRVMLSGMGGDEMNGQSLDPRIQLADLLAQRRWREFAHLLMAWSLCMRQPWIQVCLQTVGKLLPPSIQARVASRGRLESWIRPSFARRQRMSARQLEALDEAWFTRPAARDAAQTLATLARQLTQAAPSRLERRYPFLDHDLVEFLTTLPLEQLLRPGQRRSLMRRSLADVLPPEIASRKTKTSAGRCYPVALAKHWNRIENLLACPLVMRLGYIEREAMHKALLAMKNGQVPSSFLRLLKALALELWLQNAVRRGVLLHESRTPQMTETEAIREARASQVSSTAASTVLDS